MDLRGFVKRLVLPPEFQLPRELTYKDLQAWAPARTDLADDVVGINVSLDLIRRTRGGAWPTEAVTEEYDYLDLVWHECEFRDHGSFTYVLRDTDDGYLGCCYLYPMGGRTPLTDEMLAHDVYLSWRVTPPAYQAGYYTKTYHALRRWLADARFHIALLLQPRDPTLTTTEPPISHGPQGRPATLHGPGRADTGDGPGGPVGASRQGGLTAGQEHWTRAAPRPKR